MCFGGGDDSSSREMIKMQKEEAKRATEKEADRQARINAGLAAVKNIFAGSPVMKNVSNTFKLTGPAAGTKSGTAVAGLPAGYTYVQGPSTTTSGNSVITNKSGGSGSPNGGGPFSGMTTAERLNVLKGANTGSQQSWTTNTVQGIPRGGSGQGSPNGGGNTANSNPTVNNGGINASGGTSTPGGWMVRGPDGKMYNIGDDVIYGSQVDSGERSGAWQENFLNEFRQKMLDYYNPQVAEQYGDAKNETTYRHARAGTLASTGAIMNTADLSKQNKINTGKVQDESNSATNDLRKSIKDAEDAAIAQVYSTENPEVAANAASGAVQNITAETPNLTPLQDVFTVATIGGANALNGYSNASRLNTGYGSGSSAGRKQKTIFA